MPILIAPPIRLTRIQSKPYMSYLLIMKKNWIIFIVFGFLIVFIGGTVVAVRHISKIINKYVQYYHELQHDVKYADTCSLDNVFDRARVSLPSSVVRYKKGSADALNRDEEIVKNKFREKAKIRIYLYVKKTKSLISSTEISIPGYKIFSSSCVWLPVEYRLVGNDLYLFRLMIEPNSPALANKPETLKAYFGREEVELLKNPDTSMSELGGLKYSNYWERRLPNVVYREKKLQTIVPPEKWLWKKWIVLNDKIKKVKKCSFSSEPTYFHWSAGTEKSVMFEAGWMPQNGKNPHPEITVEYEDGFMKKILPGQMPQRYLDSEIIVNEYTPK